MRGLLADAGRLMLAAALIAALPAGVANAAPPQTPPAGAHGGTDPHQNLTPGQHLAVAAQHYEAGRVELAAETIQTALGTYPDDGSLLGSLASIELQLGRTASALAHLTRALEISPQEPSLLVNRAEIYRRFDRIDEAILDLDRVIALDTDHLAARFNRGSIRLATGDAEAAIADFEWCIAVDPHLPAPWFNRASAYHALGETGAAMDDMRRFLEISANETWNETARALLAEWGDVPVPATVKAANDS